LLAAADADTTRLAAAANADTIRLTAAPIPRPAAGSGSAQAESHADSEIIANASPTSSNHHGADRRPQLLRFRRSALRIRGSTGGTTAQRKPVRTLCARAQDGAGSKDQNEIEFTGKNPAGRSSGIRDRDRRPCEGFSKAGVTSGGQCTSRVPTVGARTCVRVVDHRTDTLSQCPGAGSAFLPVRLC